MAVYIKKVEGNSTLGIYEIEDDILSKKNIEILTPDEKTEYYLNKSEKRRIEWLCTRLLLKQIFNDNSVVIKYDPSGKPFLNNNFNISISHSGRFVAILLNHFNNVGIDIQSINPKIIRLKNKFLSEKEIKNISPVNEIEALHIYWGAKEALYKYNGGLRLNFKKNLYIDPFILNEYGKILGSAVTEEFMKPTYLFYERKEDYVLVYSI